MRLIALFMLVLALFPAPVAAQDFPALYRVTGVSADDVLNIRTEPNARSEIIGGFTPDARGIEVIGLAPNGRWGLVNAGEQTGWSSMRYLAREHGDSWREGNMALRCFGTEPFWSMPIFLPGHRAEFHSPGDGGFELVTEAGALPSTAYPPTLAIPFSGTRDGVAVLRTAVCSDGMSDRLYGLEAQLYWLGDRAGLSGCCTLAD